MKGRVVFLSLLFSLLPSAAFSQSAIYPAPSASPFPMGCIYNSTLPTITSGNTAQMQCDVNGRPLTTGIGTAPSPLPIVAGQYTRTYRGGSITAGGTAQNWASSGQIVHGCLIQDTSSAVEYIRMDGSSATTASLQLAANGGIYECPVTAGPSTSASILGATTGQTFYAETW